jgi:hypothetical protein
VSITSHIYRTGSIPLWVLIPQDYRAAVLLHHGLHSNKEAQEKEMWSLAHAGYLAVGVDAIAHGQRHAQRDWNRPEVRYETLRETALETPLLVQHVRDSYPRVERIGGLGVSLGGFTLFSALVEHPGLLEAASLTISSPRWHELAEESPLWQHSPHHWPDRFFPTAVLIQNATMDEYVRTPDARDFAQELEPYYAQAPERLHFREYPNSSHFMREQDWNKAWDQTLGWFARWL